MLATMPGIDVSLSEQQNYYEELLKQYKRETEHFHSYKDMCKFDLNTQLDAAAAAGVENGAAAVAATSSSSDGKAVVSAEESSANDEQTSQTAGGASK